MTQNQKPPVINSLSGILVSSHEGSLIVGPMTIRMSDTGTPYRWPHMNGYSSHTYSRISSSPDVCDLIAKSRLERVI